jgi:hypothetical protein
MQVRTCAVTARVELAARRTALQPRASPRDRGRIFADLCCRRSTNAELRENPARLKENVRRHRIGRSPPKPGGLKIIRAAFGAVFDALLNRNDSVES